MAGTSSATYTGRDAGGDNMINTASTNSRQKEIDVDVLVSGTLDQSILRSAISSGMPTYLHATGVPIIDRRKKKLVTSAELAQVDKKNLTREEPIYPPSKPLCLRGHTPATGGTSSKTIVPRVRVRPRRSVRGPRGVADIPPGRFFRPGVLGGLSVSPWEVQEGAERMRRKASHKHALFKDSLVFRRKRDEGGLLDYAEETYAVKRFLDTTHPIRDESCPPKSGFSYRRVNHETEPPDFYDTRLDSVRPRTVGYSPGHVRSLSPTPMLTWGGRESSRASLEWGAGTGGPLGVVEASLGGSERYGCRRLRPYSVPTPSVNKQRSWAVDAFGSEEHPADRHESNQECPDDDRSRDHELEIRPMWSRQGSSHLGISASPCSALRPFSSSCDHLGRPMTHESLSRSTAGLKPQQFDTSQRKSEYSGALAAKRRRWRARATDGLEALRLDKERRKGACEEREGIKRFESRLKDVLARQWKYL